MSTNFRLFYYFVIFLILFTFGCRRNISDKKDSLKIGLTYAKNKPLEISGLLIIADELDYFKRYNLDVQFIPQSSGANGLKALENQEIDLATTAEFAFTKKVMDGKDMKIIACITEVNEEYLVSEKKSGINTPQSLKGKRIAYPVNTQLEYDLEMYLLSKKLSSEDIVYFPVSPKEVVSLFENNEVDAFAHWEPHIRNYLGNKNRNTLNIWLLQEDQPFHWVLAGNQNLISEKSNVLKRMLMALIDAEEFLSKDKETVIEILKKRCTEDPSYIDYIFPQMDMKVTLKQSLIIILEHQARWIKNRNNENENDIPDFYEKINTKILSEIDKEKSTIIK